ncbi:hypothetical protein D9M72_341080 [compost metagenome]
MMPRACSFWPTEAKARAASRRTHGLVGSAAMASSSARRAPAVSPRFRAARAWARASSARSLPSEPTFSCWAGVRFCTMASASALLFCADSTPTSPRVASGLSGCCLSTRR